MVAPKKQDQDEITNKPIKAKKKPSGKKRPRRIFLSYEKAREFVRSELIPSKAKYDDWYVENKPHNIPRLPHRVYKEWTTWMDFLGTENTWGGGKQGTSWRSLEEATIWAHTINMKSRAEWFAWVKLPGNLPADVPARPDMYYKHWVGWNHFLGNKLTDAALAQQDVKKVQIFFLIRYPDVPGNVLTIGVEPMGITGMRERWERKNYDIIGLFWFDEQKADQMQQYIRNKSTPYLGDDRQRIFPNVWDFVWDMSVLFEQVNLEATVARQE